MSSLHKPYFSGHQWLDRKEVTTYLPKVDGCDVVDGVGGILESEGGGLV